MAKVSAKTHKLELLREDNGDGSAYEYYPLGEHTVIAPGVCGGRPTFKGTRVEVEVVLDWMRAGDGIDDILEGYPSLSRPAVQEAVSMATRVEQHPPISA